MVETKLTFPNEIYKKVASEFDLDERQVKYIYDSYAAEIAHIANYTDAASIKLPHLGVMYVNKKFVESEIKYLSKTGNDPEKLKAYKQKKEVIDREIRNYGNKPALMKRCLHVKKSRIANPYFNYGKSLREIEEIQNSNLEQSV